MNSFNQRLQYFRYHLKIIQACVSLTNVSACEVLIHSHKCFTFGTYICSLTSMFVIFMSIPFEITVLEFTCYKYQLVSSVLLHIIPLYPYVSTLFLCTIWMPIAIWFPIQIISKVNFVIVPHQIPAKSLMTSNHHSHNNHHQRYSLDTIERSLKLLIFFMYFGLNESVLNKNIGCLYLYLTLHVTVIKIQHYTEGFF